MKGFVSVEATDIIPLVEKAIKKILDGRDAQLEAAITAEQTKRIKQTFLEWIFNDYPENTTSREQAILNLQKRSDDFFSYSMYSRIMEDNAMLLKEMYTLQRAATLVDGKILVDLKTSAYLKMIKESV